MLLGEVRELEVEPEGAEDERLRIRLEPTDEPASGDCPAAPRVPRLAPDALDELEQPGSLLFDEHVAEDRPEQANVAAERSGGVAHARSG